VRIYRCSGRVRRRVVSWSSLRQTRGLKPGEGEGAIEADIPNSRELYERARAHIPGGSSRSTLFVAPHPPYAQRGEGCKLVDVDGHELIDLHNNFSALVHGHAFPPVVEAVSRAAAEGASFGLPTAAEVQLAEHLATRVPWAERWRFAGSGTEAVMGAVRIARAVSGREKLVRFGGCYHGGADALLQPGTPGVPRSAQSDVLTLPFGDEQAFRDVLEEQGDRIAAVLLDLLPNRLGLHPVAQEFATLMRSETARRGIALILDEVITFRLAVGGLQSLYGIEGDLITLGKVIGGGLPIGAVGGRAQWMDVLAPAHRSSVALAGTFTANPVSMCAGLAALEALDAGAIERINVLGDHLRVGLQARGYEVAGRGSLLKIHKIDAKNWWRLYREGVLVAADGLACISTPMDETTKDSVLATLGS
jgi:glutamate-1-semialdehyde 2,1-aminomutase